MVILKLFPVSLQKLDSDTEKKIPNFHVNRL